MNTTEFLMVTSAVAPDRDAIVFEGQRFTYMDLQLRSSKLANALATLGVQKGDKVANIEVNTPNCVEAYFDDLYRIKSFHGYELGDRHKKAGFTMKWISKIKPLQLTTQDPIDRYAFLVNERFALAVSLPFLDYEQEAEPAISPNFIENLLFSLHYREHDSEVLAILAYLLECSINQETP